MRIFLVAALILPLLNISVLASSAGETQLVVLKARSTLDDKSLKANFELLSSSMNSIFADSRREAVDAAENIRNIKFTNPDEERAKLTRLKTLVGTYLSLVTSKEQDVYDYDFYKNIRATWRQLHEKITSDLLALELEVIDPLSAGEDAVMKTAEKLCNLSTWKGYGAHYIRRAYQIIRSRYDTDYNNLESKAIWGRVLNTVRGRLYIRGLDVLEDDFRLLETKMPAEFTADQRMNRTIKCINAANEVCRIAISDPLLKCRVGMAKAELVEECTSRKTRESYTKSKYIRLGAAMEARQSEAAAYAATPGLSEDAREKAQRMKRMWDDAMIFTPVQ